MLALFLLVLSIVCALVKTAWKILAVIIAVFLILGITVTPILAWWCAGLCIASLVLNVTTKSKDE